MEGKDDASNHARHWQIGQTTFKNVFYRGHIVFTVKQYGVNPYMFTYKGEGESQTQICVKLSRRAVFFPLCESGFLNPILMRCTVSCVVFLVFFWKLQLICNV